MQITVCYATFANHGYPSPIASQSECGQCWSHNINSSGERTRHIDIRAHFIKGFVLHGMIDIVFVMSAQNDSDLFTKNLPSVAHRCHSEKVVWTVEEMNQQ